MLEKEADKIVPFTMFSDGDELTFDIGKMIEVIFKCYGLDDLAKRERVEIAVTLDGADLNKSIQYVMGGFKIVDIRAIDPCTNKNFYGSDASKVQSRNNCYLTNIIIGKDCKDMYDEQFKSFLNFSER